MKWIIIIVIALLVLSYYGYDIRKVVESDTTRNNFAYAGEVVSDVWKDYIQPSAIFIWEKINSAVDNK